MDNARVKTAMFRAIRAGDGEELVKALGAGASIWWTYRNRTALEIACSSVGCHIGKLFDVVRPLLSAGARWPEGVECELARFLIAGQQPGLLEQLLENCRSDMERYSTLRQEIQSLVLDCAVAADEQEAVAAAKVVFRAAADVEQRFGTNRMPVLHAAVTGKSPFVTSDSLLGLAWRHHHAPLFRGRGHQAVLQHLLSLGPRLDCRWAGFTPLHVAALTGHEAAFNAFIDAGADIDALDANDQEVGIGYGLITAGMLAKLQAARLAANLGRTLQPQRSAERARL